MMAFGVFVRAEMKSRVRVAWAHGGVLVHVPCRGWQAAGGRGGSGDSPGSWALGLCSAPSAADRARDGFLLLEGPAEPS